MEYKSTIQYIKHKLPKAPGIIWENNYQKAAVLIPILKIDQEIHLLFQVRSDNIKQGSEVCFPGGKFDKSKDMNLKDTAIRETIEELGIEKNKIEYIGQFNKLLHHMGMLIDTYIGFLHIGNISELKIDDNEVKKVFTIPFSFFKNSTPEEYRVRIEAQSTYIDKTGKKIPLLPVEELGLPKRYLTPWGNCNHKVIVYKTEEGIIWGMTAKIVYEFISLYYS